MRDRDRVDTYLDGEIDRTALSPQESAEADTIAHLVEEMRTFVGARPAPDLTAPVLRRLAQVGPPDAPDLLRRLAEGLWTPREVTFRMRPAHAALAAAAILALAIIVPLQWRAAPQSPSAQTAGEPRLFVQFRLERPAASEVRLAGSFTNWQPIYHLHEAAPGLWTITLPLTQGVHDYVFVVDGEQWIPDPYAQHVADGFGGTNSRIALLPPEIPRS